MANSFRLKDVFLISLTALVCLSGGLLTWLDGHLLPVGLTIPLAIAAYVFCEHLRWIRLGDWGANLCGIVALVAAGYEFFGEGQEAKLLSGAHLLTYVLWIILFQDKEDSWHWWTVVLTILQIAVCSVLTYDIWFGFWLILYVVMTIWTLAVFWMFMVETQFRLSESVDNDRFSTNASGTLVTLGNWTKSPNQFPLLEFESGSVTHSIQMDPSESWISPRFLGGFIAMSIAVILAGFTIFLLIPRMWADVGVFGSEYSAAVRSAMPGFTDRVRLNDVSANVDNPRTVFKVRMFELDGRKPINIETYASELGMSEPLFRGAVLSHYEGGTWSPNIFTPSSEIPVQHLSVWGVGRDRPSGIPLDEPIVVQEYEIVPLETNTLFTMGEIRAAGDRSRRRSIDVLYDVVTHEIHYKPERDVRGFTYRVVTPRSPEIVSHPNRIYPIISPRDYFLELPENLTKLSETSWKIVGSSPDPARQSFETRSARTFRLDPDIANSRIEKLLSYLRNNPDFHYQLSAPTVDPALDPVEDFLLNRKAGHCEYYASALALMLRSVNIPARVITGFKGGIPDSKDLSMTVLQRNAHAWVEAYDGIRWRTCDPTPAADEIAMAGSQLSLWEIANRFVRDGWNNYVINMTIEDQNGVAAPVLESVRQKLSDGQISSLVRWSFTVFSTPKLWFSWQGGLLLLILGTFLLALRFLYFLFRKFGSKLIKKIAGTEQEITSKIEFYDKFLSIMENRGLRPLPWQTQGEFASKSLSQLPISPEQRSSLTDLIPRLFYQVRFGSLPLSPEATSHVQSSLQVLAGDLRNAEKSTPSASDN